jgi:hypothetical protein
MSSPTETNDICLDIHLDYERVCTSKTPFHLYLPSLRLKLRVPMKYMQRIYTPTNNTTICLQAFKNCCLNSGCPYHHIEEQFWNKFARNPNHYLYSAQETSEQYFCVQLDISDDVVETVSHRYFGMCIDYFKKNNVWYFVFSSEEERNRYKPAPDLAVAQVNVTCSRPLYLGYDDKYGEVVIMRCDINDSFRNNQNSKILITEDLPTNGDTPLPPIKRMKTTHTDNIISYPPRFDFEKLSWCLNNSAFPSEYLKGLRESINNINISNTRLNMIFRTFIIDLTSEEFNLLDTTSIFPDAFCEYNEQYRKLLLVWPSKDMKLSITRCSEIVNKIKDWLNLQNSQVETHQQFLNKVTNGGGALVLNFSTIHTVIQYVSGCQLRPSTDVTRVMELITPFIALFIALHPDVTDLAEILDEWTLSTANLCLIEESDAISSLKWFVEFISGK